MPPSPRKTRSCSRLVSASYDPDSAPDSPLLASPAHLAVTAVPVMKAESMEPARGYQPGSEKRARHKMTEPQLQRLEALYRANTHPDRQAKEDVAKETGMPLKTVLIWFQNRRQDRRRSKAAAASKAAAQRAERAQAPKVRKPPAAKSKTSPPRKKLKITVTATPTATPTSITHAQTAARQPSPQATAPTVSSHADDLMDVDESSPSTAPTSVHGYTKRLPRVARSPSSSLDSSSSADTGPNALWRFINVSPPPPPPLPLPAPSQCGAGPARRPFGNLQGQQQHVARRADLEWACANSAFRRKHGQYVYRDEDDSEGESSGHEGLPAHGAENITEPQDAPSLILRRRWQQREAAGAEPHNDLPSDLRVNIPREYDLLFPPDMVLGASLLLTLKHSTGSARL